MAESWIGLDPMCGRRKVAIMNVPAGKNDREIIDH